MKQMFICFCFFVFLLTIIKMRDIHGHAILFVSFGLVRIIFCMSKRRYFHITRSRESIKTSIFTPPALSTGVWEEPPQYSIRDLLQC